MPYMRRIMQPPKIPTVTIDDLDDGGLLCSFQLPQLQGVLRVVDRLLGTFETTYGNTHPVNCLPRDGLTNGRVDAILVDTESRNRSGVREFLRDIKPLYPLVSEIIGCSIVI